MTNFEKNKDKIKEILSQGSDIAIVNGTLEKCGNADCDQCDFYVGNYNCVMNLLNWLDEDDGEPSPEISAARKAGQDEAWELACRLFVHLTGHEIDEIYGNNWSLSQIISMGYTRNDEKVKEWEENNKFHVGDVVKTRKNPDDCGNMVVIDAEDAYKNGVLVVYGKLFCKRTFSVNQLVKTGRTVPVLDWVCQIEKEE